MNIPIYEKLMMKTRLKNIYLLSIFFIILGGLVFSLVFSSASAADEYLQPSIAFQMSATLVDKNTIAIHYKIADGYYMYRERFRFQAKGALLGNSVFPVGKIKFDPNFNKNVEICRHDLTIKLPVKAADSFLLNVTSQGCADRGLCYSPIEEQVQLSLNKQPMSLANPFVNLQSFWESNTQAILENGQFFIIIAVFFVLGTALALTPCVLPMLPILLSILVGDNDKTRRRRTLGLTLSYSFGMAIVYTLLGISAGLIGEGLAATLQSPWVIGSFAVVLVLLALSMFGSYSLQLPVNLQTKLSQFSNQQSTGKFVGVFMMGALAALLVSPCIAPPLAAVLLYISQTRNVVLGGSALFFLAAGMSVPLLIAGWSAGAWLPRSGPWMEVLKRFFGIVLLALALWMMMPFLSELMEMLGWTSLGIGGGCFLMKQKNSGRIVKLLGVTLILAGIIPLIFAGNQFYKQFFSSVEIDSPKQPALLFKPLYSVQELDAVLTQAGGQPVLLDFYADWCIACKEMEKFTFQNSQVREKLAEMRLLRVDVTANTAQDKELLKRFNLFGPPAILFFDKRGQEIVKNRVIGYQNSAEFLKTLGQL